MGRHEGRIAVAVAGSFISLWLAYTFILPPFEGFDETAHYSYISLLADEAAIPDFRTSRLDRTMEHEFAAVPRPYAVVPPYENNGGLTYAAFFDSDQWEKGVAAAQPIWTTPTRPVRYSAGDAPNWQGQHPPLFYLSMTMPYRLCAGCAPGIRLLVLRLSCVGLASGSLVFWWLTVRAATATSARRILLGGGGAALLLPSNCYDLGRLGNDSLAALLLSASIFFAFRAVQQGRFRDYAALAATLAAGLVTKAFFVPCAAGLIGYFAIVALRQRTRRRAVGALVVTMAPLLISGWWFAWYAARYGQPLGSQETYVLVQRLAIGNTLNATALVGQAFVGAKAFIHSFVWCGSWSWVRRPNVEYLLMAPLLVAAVGTMARNVLVRRSQSCGELRALRWLAVAVLGPLLLGFVYHLWLCIWYTGSAAGTPGYYLQFAWPLVGLCLAGIWDLASGRGSRLALLAMISLAVVFEASGLWFSAQIYTGFVIKTGVSNFGVGGIPPTLDNLRQVHQRLSLLSFPTAALVCYALSIPLRLYVFGRLALSTPPDAAPPATKDIIASGPGELPEG
jgi:hypothetical protein